MIRTTVYSLILFIFLLLLETALLSNIVILPAVPDLMLIALLFISINNGSLEGETSGFLSGLFLDFMSAAPLGLNCLLRTILGFVTGLFHNILNVSGIFIPALLVFLATILKAFLLKIISFFFPSGIITYSILSVEFLTELILNTVLAPLIFSLLSLFSSFLTQKKGQSDIR